MSAVVPNPSIETKRPELVKPFQLLAALTGILVLIQAVLAGRGWFEDHDLIEVHGVVGNLTFICVVGLAVLAYMIGASGGLNMRLLVLTLVLLVLVVIQTGLGYSSRDSASAASWHIPNGVLIFGVIVAIAALATQLPTKSKA